MKKLLLTLLLAGMLSACAAKTDTPQTEQETQSETQSDTQSVSQSDTPQESVSDTSSPQETSADAPSSSGETDIDPVDRRIFDPYWQLSDGDPFLFAMRDNPIDEQVPKIMEGRETTTDMKEGLYIIYDLWVAEMEHSLQQLLEAIEDDGLKQQMTDAQTAWEAATDACIRADKEIIGHDGWATELFVKFPNARIQKYRERTILLKYLLYLYTDGSVLNPNIPQFLPVEP
ncbi:MAG: hypothetical protein J1E00_02905 [Oscillospiraceae bacterium]|nr:hypothetical protein [Oscillospiraceae bacterium]